MHVFDAGLTFTTMGPATFGAMADLGYAMRTGPFGGWVAAALLKAALTQARPDEAPVSMTVNLTAPLLEGPFRLDVSVQNQTRTLSFLLVEACQGEDDAVKASAQIILGQRRPGYEHREIPWPEDAPPPDQAEVIRPPEGAPRFIRNYDLRYVQGMMFNQNATSRSLIYVRDAPARPLDMLSLAAIADVPFPRLFVKRPKPANIATVTMTIYFHGLAEDLARVGTDLVLMDVIGRNFRAGFHDQAAHLWALDGTLLATSEQLVWFRDIEA